MRQGIASFLMVLFVALTACQGQQIKKRDAGAATGGVIGAGLGAIIGNQVGSSGAGVAIGAAMGAIAGGVVGNELDDQDAAHEQVEQRLGANQRIIDENQRMIDDLRGRGADVRSTARGVVVNLPDVLFEFNRSDLKSGALRAAEEIAEVVNRYPARHISVEGHTDSVGTINYNQRLSEDRARAVVSELARKGVQARRLSARGFGESAPVASNRTPEGRAKNRRVEVIIEN